MQKISDKYILIVWDSMTGGSKALAESAYEGGVSDPKINIKIMHANDVSSDDVLNAMGYIFAFPENLAAISGVMKAFFDRTYYDCIERIEGRPYAMMICAGSDGENALRQGERICTGWRLKKINDSLIVKTHAQTKEKIMATKVIAKDDLQRCHDIGAAMATGLSMGIY